MARPKKENADYFSHDCTMRNDPKIKALRRKFGLEGYAIYNMLLEVLTLSENLTIDPSDLEIELLAGDFDSATEILRNVLDYAMQIHLFKKDEEGRIFSSGLKKRLQPVFDKRTAAKDRFLKQKEERERVSVTETTQSKVKYSKVKESKVVDDNNAGAETPLSTPPTPPVPSFGSAIHPLLTLEQNKQLALSDQNPNGFVSAFCNSGLKRDMLPDWLSAFHRHLEFEGRTSKTQVDYRQHFRDWLKKLDDFRSMDPTQYTPMGLRTTKPVPPSPNSINSGVKNL